MLNEKICLPLTDSLPPYFPYTLAHHQISKMMNSSESEKDFLERTHRCFSNETILLTSDMRIKTPRLFCPTSK